MKLISTSSLRYLFIGLGIPLSRRVCRDHGKRLLGNHQAGKPNVRKSLTVYDVHKKAKWKSHGGRINDMGKPETEPSGKLQFCFFCFFKQNKRE